MKNTLTAEIIIRDIYGRKVAATSGAECAQYMDEKTGKIRHEFLLHFTVDESRADWCKVKTKGGNL